MQHDNPTGDYNPELDPHNPTTFRARLEAAFEALNVAGFDARPNHACCQSCGWAEIELDHGDDPKPALFWHAEDDQHVEDGWVCVSHGGLSRRQQRQAIRVLESFGVGVSWNGRLDTRWCLLAQAPEQTLQELHNWIGRCIALETEIRSLKQRLSLLG